MTKKSGMSMLTKALLFCFAAYACVTLVSLQVQIIGKRRQIQELKQVAAEQNVANHRLQDSIDSGMDDENIAKIARDKLRFVSTGERVFIDISSK